MKNPRSTHIIRTPIIAALVILAVALSACTAPVDGASAAREEIVNGTRETGRPAVVYLFRLDGAACTGTLISPRVVLTAKHCVAGASAGLFRIYVGSSLRNLTAEYTVSEVYEVPGSGGSGEGDDVGLLVLSTNADVTPMEISRARTIALFGQTMTAVGFGQTPSGQSGIKFTTNMTIDGVSGGYIFVTPSVCSGDSGGPLIAEDGRVWGVASFIYSPDGMTEPSCGTAPAAYNEIYPFIDFIDGILEATGTCVPRGEEVCNGIDDNCDEQVDEGCIQPGQPCTGSEECVGGNCADTVIGRVCATECDPLRPDLGCGPGFYCGASNNCMGHCVPGGAGERANDSECSTDTDCLSLLCADPGDGRRRCLDPCKGDAGLCLAGEVCAAPGGSCGGCVPQRLVGSARGLGEPCGGDGDCRGDMVCNEYGGIRECARACTAADCGDGFECRDMLCIRDRLQGVGGPCVTNQDCGAGVCASQGGRRWCTSSCGGDGDCPADFTCLDAGGAMVCAPEASLIGEACAENADCVTDLCASIGGSGTCTSYCDARSSCGPGFECVRTDPSSHTAVCVRAGAPASTTGGCSVHADRPGRGRWALAIGVAMLGLMLWRRRHG